MKKIVLLAFFAITLLPLTVSAQDSKFQAYVEADLISHYMWRGQDRGGISIQPEVGLSLGDFSFRATGNVGFDKDDEEEINLTLGFEKFGFNIGVTDYWRTGIDIENRYFYYDKEKGAHSFEGNLGFSCKYFSLQGYTVFWGNDFKTDGTRAYSTYVELTLPFHIGDIDLDVKTGITPMESAGEIITTEKKDDLGNLIKEPKYEYAEGFACNMVSLRATKTFYYKSMQFPIFAELHTNPYLQKANFLVGVSVVAF